MSSLTISLIPRSKNALRITLILALLGLTEGCASSGKWVREVPPTLKAAPETSRSVAQAAESRVITLRWPAVVDAGAKPTLIENYRRYVYADTGYDTPRGDLGSFPEFLESSSTLYAAELYWALRRTDPSIVVLLEPHVIRVGRGGKLVSQPLIDPLPHADVAAYLWVYSHPNTALPLVVSVMTFSVNSSPLRSPDNCGILFSTIDTEPLRSAVGKVTCTEPSPGDKLISHWLLDGELRKESFVTDRRTATLPLSRSSTLIAPAMIEGNAGIASATVSEYVKRSRPAAPEDAETTVLNPFVENYASITVSGLGVIEPASAKPQTMVPYVRQFDPPLADKIASAQALSVNDTKNLALIRRMQTQELQVRARRDEAIARETLTGDFGQNFRKARDDAYANYGSKMAKMWMTTASSVALGSALLQTASSGAAVLAANNTTFDSFNQKMEAQGLEYVTRLAPSLNSLSQASLGMLDNSINVAISDQAGLRAALKAFYQKRKFGGSPLNQTPQHKIRK